MKKSKLRALPALIFILLIGFLYFAVNGTEQSAEEEKFTVLQDAIVRSAVQCYAVEGFYPPDIAYLEDNYGLIVDRSKYVINYSVFASNIIPDITVYQK